MNWTILHRPIQEGFEMVAFFTVLFFWFKSSRRKGFRAVVVSPTRELAQQVNCD